MPFDFRALYAVIVLTCRLKIDSSCGSLSRMFHCFRVLHGANLKRLGKAQKKSYSKIPLKFPCDTRMASESLEKDSQNVSGLCQTCWGMTTDIVHLERLWSEDGFVHNRLGQGKHVGCPLCTTIYAHLLLLADQFAYSDETGVIIITGRQKYEINSFLLKLERQKLDVCRVLTKSLTSNATQVFMTCQVFTYQGWFAVY